MSFIEGKQNELKRSKLLNVGDINYADSDWSILMSSDEDEQVFLDGIAELKFDQLITGTESLNLT